jgi:FO synthase
VLEETGLLPHLNPGVLSWAELHRLRPVAPSMGMMLETTSERLWSTPGAAHYKSPDKQPAVRLRVLEDAGRVGIPFTTGILIGIGETLAERAESLHALRRIAREYGHLQEIIIQNFRAKADTAMRAVPDAAVDDLAATVAVARLVLGPKARIQAPPNLLVAAGTVGAASTGGATVDAGLGTGDPMTVGAEEVGLLLRAGIDDWGGVSPVTPDHVNPERPWPQIDALAGLCADAGFTLRERLTIYPEYVRAWRDGAPWVDPRIAPHVRALADPLTGLAIQGATPEGIAWQEPDAAVTSGRVDLHATIDTAGRTGDRRSDFDTVYGDWAQVAEHARATGAPTSGGAADAAIAAALRLAESRPEALLRPEHESAALALFESDGPALDALVRLADDLRRDVVGDDITYVVNRNINFTNVCYVGCRFCAFAQRERDADSYRLSVEQVADRAEEAFRDGATEVCMQGGIDPSLPATAYADLVRAVKQRVPSMHVHAFSPMEIVTGAARAGVSIADFLTELREAGLDTIPGTAAEILDDDVRWVLTKGKLPASAWVEVVTTAHRLGIRSSSTMMYGHVDHPRHWLHHLRVLADIQATAGGFTEFVALPFVHHNAPIYLAGVARPGPSWRENRVVHAMARLLLHRSIDNIQCSWVKLGDRGTLEMLSGGCNDLGGTLMEETISRMAGSEHGSARTVAELHAIAAAAGRSARERTTTYGVPTRPATA